MSDINQGEIATQSQFCSQCGDKLGLGIRFCGKCGAAVAMNASLSDSSTGSGLVQNAPSEQDTQRSLTITQGWACYAAGIAIMAIVFKFAVSLAIVMYFVSGVFMSRFVMRRLVEWHPQYNTLHNVVSSKLGMVAFWPFSMLSLLFKLSANHVL